jgi:hypothetical protein
MAGHRRPTGNIVADVDARHQPVEPLGELVGGLSPISRIRAMHCSWIESARAMLRRTGASVIFHLKIEQLREQAALYGKKIYFCRFVFDAVLLEVKK